MTVQKLKKQSLLDLELAVTICFGSARMPLKEVLDLDQGSVLELDRSFNDPVEILVNDTVIAAGEVVAVDGHYGVRITEVFAQTLSGANRELTIPAGPDIEGDGL